MSNGNMPALIANMVKIGCIGFGGGNALVPVIEREIVQGSSLISQEEFDKEVVVANITPGALPIEIASGTGRVIAGELGMVLCALGMALPGALLTLALIFLFSGAADMLVEQMRFASVGIAMLIVVLLVEYAVKAIRDSEPRSRVRAISIGLTTAVFILTGGKKLVSLLGFDATWAISLSTLDVLGVVFFAIFFSGGRFGGTRLAQAKTVASFIIALLYLLSANAVGPFAASAFKPAFQVLMIVLALIGFAASFRQERGPSTAFPVRQMAREVATWVAFLAVFIAPALVTCPDALAFAAKAILSVLMSFGGGDAYLAFGQAVFVDSGMISPADYFESVVTISNAMPGSIIAKVLTGVGFYVGTAYGAPAAIFTALAGFGCGVGASGLTFLVMYYVYERFEPLSVFSALKRYIRPVIGGLLLSIGVTMFSLNVNVAHAFGIGLTSMLVLSAAILAILIWAGEMRRWSLVALIGCAVASSVLACNVLVIV